MSEAREKRYHDGIELRASSEGTPGPGTLVGYAAKFDRRSEVLRDKRTGRSFVEVIRHGAFARSVKDADVRALYDHDTGKVLGRSTAGTLRMAEDAVGLRVEIDLPDTTAGRDTAHSVGRGDVRGMSFGFVCGPDGDSWDRSGEMPVRSLHDVSIDDVTVTAFPAYPDTEIALRSLDRAEAAARSDPEPDPEPEAPAGGSEVPDARPEPEAGRDDGPDVPEAGPEPAAPAAEVPGPDPEAVRREHQRDRDLLKLLRAR